MTWHYCGDNWIWALNEMSCGIAKSWRKPAVRLLQCKMYVEVLQKVMTHEKMGVSSNGIIKRAGTGHIWHGYFFNFTRLAHFYNMLKPYLHI